MSLLKYFGEQDKHHNGNLFWSNAKSGLPFRGQYAPTITQHELESQVDTTMEFHQKFFDLSIEEDQKFYQWVMDRIVNGLFAHHFIDRRVDHANNKVTVYIEWSQKYLQLSPHAKAARSQGHVFTPSSAPNLAGLQEPSTGISK